MVISQYLTSLIPPLPLPSLWQDRSLPVHQLWKSLEPPSWSYFLVCIYSFTHYLHLESSHIYPSIQAFLNLSSWKCLPVICSCYLGEGEFQGGLVASHAIAQLAQNFIVVQADPKLVHGPPASSSWMLWLQAEATTSGYSWLSQTHLKCSSWSQSAQVRCGHRRDSIF